jgi:hypothetical protein
MRQAPGKAGPQNTHALGQALADGKKHIGGGTGIGVFCAVL